MARLKKTYNSYKADGRVHQSRGGVEGKTVDTSFGSTGNHRTSKHNYPTQDLKDTAAGQSPTYIAAIRAKKMKVKA